MPRQNDLGDMDTEDFRREAHKVVDWIADYLAGVHEYPVLSRVRRGDVRRGLPSAPPGAGEPIEAILQDFEKIVVPGITHWNHPGFLGYFGITGSGPGILGE